MKSTVSLAATALIVGGVVAALFGVQQVLPSSSEEPASDYYSLSGQGIDLGPTGGASAEVGQAAPDFSLLDINGKPVNLSGLRGQTILINFWATWCLPCRREMPDIEDAFLERQSSGFMVLGVNLQEGTKPAREFAEKYSVTFPILLDTKGEVAKAYRLTGLPESWIVDSDGILREHKIGAFSQKELALMLDGVMKKTAAQQD